MAKSWTYSLPSGGNMTFKDPSTLDLSFDGREQLVALLSNSSSALGELGEGKHGHAFHAAALDSWTLGDPQPGQETNGQAPRFGSLPAEVADDVRTATADAVSRYRDHFAGALGSLKPTGYANEAVKAAAEQTLKLARAQVPRIVDTVVKAAVAGVTAELAPPGSSTRLTRTLSGEVLHKAVSLDGAPVVPTLSKAATADLAKAATSAVTAALEAELGRMVAPSLALYDFALTKIAAEGSRLRQQMDRIEVNLAAANRPKMPAAKRAELRVARQTTKAAEYDALAKTIAEPELARAYLELAEQARAEGGA